MTTVNAEAVQVDDILWTPGIRVEAKAFDLVLNIDDRIFADGFAVNGVGAFAQQMPVAGHLDQRIVIVRDAFRTFLDLLVGDDVVEHGRRVVDDVADDVSVRTRVNGLGEGPGFDPGFQFRNGDQRQQCHVRATPLNRI